jgi:hypothetical protein
VLGHFIDDPKLIHSNVPIATITITPTRAAIGNFSITGAPNRIMINMVNAATIPDKRALEPAERLTNVCAIMDNRPYQRKTI